jgi:eukaryotic-like serine/threonine-protein kinase
VTTDDKTLGPYNLISKIAEGGMATIFLAEKTGPGGFGKQLVIKRILPHLADDAKFVEMFLDEARNAANFNHPNIVQIYDFGSADKHYFIAMEFIDGYDLAGVADRVHALKRRIPPVIAARIIADALGGLDYAHSFTDPRSGEPLHLVHRDISPHNLLVNKDGNVKLVDFGVAKAKTSSAKTETGAVKGKFSYMAPEQIAGEPLDGRADIFAMGITLYELSVGKRPFGDVSEMMAINAILTRPPIPSRDAGADLPQEFEDIIFKALEKDRNQRYRSAMEMQTALEVFIQHIAQRPITPREVAQYLRLLVASDITGLNKFEAELLTPSNHGPVTTRHAPTPGQGVSALPSSQPYGGAQPNTPVTQGSSKGLVVAIVVILILLVGGGSYLIIMLLEDPKKDPSPATDSAATAVAADDVASAPDATTPIATATQAPTSDAPDVTSAPPVMDVVSAPPVVDVASAPPVVDVASAPPVADVASAPPVADVTSAPPVVDVTSAPPVADVTTPPPAVVKRSVQISSPHEVAVIDSEGIVLVRRLSTSAETISLAVGKHNLTIRSLEAGSKAEKTILVEVTPDTVSLPPFDFNKIAFELDTVPSEGVEVFFNNKSLGKSPFTKEISIIEGEHTVELHMGGHKQVYESFRVDNKLQGKRLVINLKENKFRIR